MKKYDCIIIGGGLSGLTAALYLKRSNKSVIVFDRDFGGNITKTNSIKNFPGFLEISGEQLIDNLTKQCTSIGVDIVYQDANNLSLFPTDYPEFLYKITTENNDEILGTILIIATGTTHKELQVPIENSNIHYCALCDGEFYKGKSVAVIGGGNTAISSAIYLRSIGCKVTVFTRSVYRASEDLITNASGIELNAGINIESIIDNMIKIHYTVGKSERTESLKYDGYFVCIGQSPNSDFSKLTGIELGDGVEYTRIDCPVVGNYDLKYNYMTNKRKIFACGSVLGIGPDQAVIAAADGAKCALEVIKFLNYC